MIACMSLTEPLKWGLVRIKVSDKTQTEINKTKPISNVNNHVVYYNTANWKGWNGNSLIHKDAVEQLIKYGDKPNLKNIDKLVKARMDVPTLTYRK